MKKSTKNLLIILVAIFIILYVVWRYSTRENFFTRPSDKKLIYFYSNNCKYCHSFDHIWTLFSQNVNSNCMEIAKVNIDNSPNHYGVRSVPTVLAIKDSYVMKMPGPKTYENLINFFTQFRGI